MKSRLGRQETLLLAYAHMRKLRLLRMGELTGPLQLSGAQERELFRRLLRGGIIARVRPGLFLVPPRLPLGDQPVNVFIAPTVAAFNRRTPGFMPGQVSGVKLTA